ncbi:hypothetical protein D3C84_1068150 [compost metagenome]
MSEVWRLRLVRPKKSFIQAETAVAANIPISASLIKLIQQWIRFDAIEPYAVSSVEMDAGMDPIQYLLS